MTDDPNENNWCDHGYCQLAEMAEQSRKNLARIESYAATIARLEGEVASWRMASTEAEKEVAAVRAQRSSAEAKVAALVEAGNNLAEKLRPIRDDLIFSKRTAFDTFCAALAAAKEGA